MKKFLLAATALVMSFGGAQAADLPSRKAPPPMMYSPAPVYSWTGFYVGASIGYGWMDKFNTAGPFGFAPGGRIAVVQGNILRNMLPKRPIGTAPDDDAGIGIYVEADSVVSGNVIENAPSFGIIAGWGKYLRDVSITGNVIRNAFAGIGISVADGAGTALVDGNLVSGAPRGAVVGLDHARPVTADLTASGAQRFAQVALGTNTVR